jgi:hypothetical protein
VRGGDDGADERNMEVRLLGGSCAAARRELRGRDLHCTNRLPSKFGRERNRAPDLIRVQVYKPPPEVGSEPELDGAVRRCRYGWTGQETGSGLSDLAPSILHYNWF